MKVLEKSSVWGCLSFLSISGGLSWGVVCSMVWKQSGYVEWVFLNSGSVKLEFVLFFDWISLLFFSVVAMIASSVFLFSESYMKSDRRNHLFFILVFIFVMSMFFMVFSLNLVSLMLGWDGLGLTSYVLVVYYQNEKSSAAGMITALSNRIGDSALMLGIASMMEYGSWEICSMELESGSLSYLILLAAITKSAQIPFSAWLPAAMAAPTPVSALVHSSTLVTAGIYLLIRFYPCVSGWSWGLPLMLFLGVLTSLMAGCNALLESDLKKTVALSTLSQLGIMMIALGVGVPLLSYFHMLTHALFKALLFMCSGKLIHTYQEGQDLRLGGGVLYSLPVTCIIMNLSNYALCGFPFLAGFYSKDLLVEVMLGGDLSGVVFALLYGVVGLSVTYSIRFTFFSLVTPNQQGPMSEDEEDWVMVSAKMGLVGFSIVGGALIYWISMPNPWMISLPGTSKSFVWIGFGLGILWGSWLISWEFEEKQMKKKIFWMESSMNMWFLTFLSASSLIKLGSVFSSSISKVSESWLEEFGGQGGSKVLLSMSGVELKALFNFFKYSLVVSISVLIVMSV